MTTPREHAAPRRRPKRPAGPTITDVAALAGVSKSAVSKVFNNRSGISEPTRERILRAAAQLGWSPSASATALRGERTRTLGLVINRPTDLLTSDPYFTELIAGMEQELAPFGYGLQLHLVGTDTAREEEVYERLARERRVDAVLLTESRIGDSRYRLLDRLHLPALLLGRPWDGYPIDHLHTPGTEEAVTAAVEHLLALGHRRIAYLVGPDDRMHTQARRRIVESVLAAHQLTARPVLSTDFSSEAAAAGTESVLAADAAERPTAILYANDTMALVGMGTAGRLGLRVPEDLSVVGYDDLPIGRWHHPQLTTISQDVRAAGRAAALRLLYTLGEQAEPLGDLPAPRLVIRGSTGPVPGQAP